MESGDRSFTLVALKKPGQKTEVRHQDKATRMSYDKNHRYISKTPRDAASKAISRACRLKDIRGQCTLLVTMKETTRGSANKEYKYRAKRIKEKDPFVLETDDGDKIPFKYRNQLKSMNIN